MSLGSRLAALALDLGLLLAAYLLALFVGLSLTGRRTSEIALWVALVWALVDRTALLRPLPRVRRPGGRPRRDARPARARHLRSDADSPVSGSASAGRSPARTEDCSPSSRSFRRSSISPLSPGVTTVVPGTTGCSAPRCRGRRAASMRSPRRRPSAALTDLFAPAGGCRRRSSTGGRDGSSVVSGTIVRATLLVNVGLGRDRDAARAADRRRRATSTAGLFWLGLALMLFGSGVFWTQAVIVTAVEAARTGEIDVSAREVVRRASRRVNALTAALVLLMSPYILTMVARPPSPSCWGARVLLPLLSLVVPAIVLEDRTVLGAFGRSWRLVTRRAGLTFLLFLASGLLLLATIGVTLGVAVWIIDLVAPGRGVRSPSPWQRLSRCSSPACRSAACSRSWARPGASSTTTCAVTRRRGARGADRRAPARRLLADEALPLRHGRAHRRERRRVALL